MDNAQRLRINALFTPRPTLRQTARTLLYNYLREKHPGQTPAFDDLRLAEKIYIQVNNKPRLSHYNLMSLLDAFIQCVCRGTAAHFVPNHHYLMQSRKNAPPRTLSVTMDALSLMFNECAERLMPTFKQALVAFWSEPCANDCDKSPWESLAQLFLQDMNRRCGALTQASAEDGARISSLIQLTVVPQRSRRIDMFPGGTTRAYVADIDLLAEHSAQHHEMARALVIRSNFRGVNTLALYTPTRGIEIVESMADIGLALSRQSGMDATNRRIQWRLHEPLGDAFLYLAMLVLEHQLQLIDNAFRLTVSGNRGMLYFESQLQEITSPVGKLDNPGPAESGQYRQLLDSLPDWLTKASSAERSTYGQLIDELARLQARTRGQSWMDGIAPLPQFTAQALLRQIRLDHPQFTLGLDDLDVRMAVIPPGSPALPTSDEEVQISTLSMPQLLEQYAVFTPITLTELALANIAGKPDGYITVRSRTGRTLPDWLAPNTWATHRYLAGLIEKVDAGTQYIAFLKSKLIDDPVEAARRQTLFADQLRLQLPLLALQNNLRREAGVSALGARYIQAVLQTQPLLVDGQQILLKPLAFIPAPGWEADSVTNMFVIGPAAHLPGPQILYRPQASAPLLEFSSSAALLAAIGQPGELQTQVLAWLDDRNRPTYANNGFNEPHLERFSPNIEDDFSSPRASAPVVLSDTALSGDALVHLFQANTRYLIELADRSSVSTAQSRWMMVKEAGWMLFTNILPYVSGPVAVAGWLLAGFVALHETLSAVDEGHTAQARQAFIDFLFNIGSVLLFHRLAKVSPLIEPEELRAVPFGRAARPPSATPLTADAPLEEPGVGATPVQPAVSTPVQLPTAPENQSPDVVHSQLDFRWSLQYSILTQAQRNELAELLRPFSSRYSTADGERIADGPHQGLYRIRGLLYADIRENLYRTANDASGRFIVQDDHPHNTGPWIIRSPHMNWDFDFGLRLKGGGPKRILELRQQKQQQLDTIRANLKRSDDEINTLKNDLIANRTRKIAELGKEPGNRSLRPIDEAYKALLDKLFACYDRSYLILLEEHALQPVTGLENILARILEDQISLTRRLRELYEGETMTVRNEHPMFASDEAAEEAIETGGNDIIRKLDIYLVRLAAANEGAIKWLGNELAKMKELALVPKVGFAKAAELGSARNLEVNIIGWKAYLAEVIRPLVAPISIGVDLKLQVNVILGKAMDSVELAAQSQRELIGSGLDQSYEAAEVLNSNILKYEKAQNSLNNLARSHGQYIRPRYLNRLLELIDDLHVQAQQKMQSLIQENPMLLRRPPPAKNPPGSSRTPSNTVVIHTRDEGSLAAELEPLASGQTVRKAIIKDPVRQTLIATYEESPDDDIWVKVQAPGPLPSSPPRKGLPRLQADARNLLGEVEEALGNARISEKTGQLPIDAQEILDNKAARLGAQADELQHYLDTSNTNGSNLGAESISTASGLINELRLQAARLTAQGRTSRINMIKAQAPQPQRVHYLVEQGEASIHIAGPRIDVSRGKGEDFIQEYAIVDKEHTPLWYAHFHYPAMDTAPGAYVAAHLKTVEQRYVGRLTLLKWARTHKKMQAVLRSEISPKMARILFLSLHDRLAMK